MCSLTFLVLVICTGCASGAGRTIPDPVEEPQQSESNTSVTATEIGESSSPPDAEAPSAITPVGTNVVFFVPGEESATLDGDELKTAEEEHVLLLQKLFTDGRVSAFGRIDDGSWMLFMPETGLASLGELLHPSPLYGRYGVRHAAFEFTVGELCEPDAVAVEGLSFLVEFLRDPATINGPEPLAPSPFGSELGDDHQVVAAGSWGYGHVGFVILLAPGIEEATSIADTLFGTVDPQWRWTVRGFDLNAGALCNKPPG